MTPHFTYTGSFQRGKFDGKGKLEHNESKDYYDGALDERRLAPTSNGN